MRFVGIERMRDKSQAAPLNKAVVTYYRYFDDLTVTAVVDLETGKTTNLDACSTFARLFRAMSTHSPRHSPKRESEEVKALFAKYGEQDSDFTLSTANTRPMVTRETIASCI